MMMAPDGDDNHPGYGKNTAQSILDALACGAQASLQRLPFPETGNDSPVNVLFL